MVLSGGLIIRDIKNRRIGYYDKHAQTCNIVPVSSYDNFNNCGSASPWGDRGILFCSRQIYSSVCGSNSCSSYNPCTWCSTLAGGKIYKKKGSYSRPFTLCFIRCYRWDG